MRRHALAPLLICALLALPGCGAAESVAKRVVLGAGGALAGLLFDAEEGGATHDDVVEKDGVSIAERAAGFFASEDEGPAAEVSGSGFYKIVEANGTVRFVSDLSQVPPSQRPNAERLAIERSQRFLQAGEASAAAARHPATRRCARSRTLPFRLVGCP